MQGVIPRLANHPGTVWRTGPALGEDNEYVLQDLLGLDNERVSALRESGVISPALTSVAAGREELA